MKTPRISEAIGNLPEDLVSDAVTYKRASKKKAFVKWGSIAACFCLIVSIMIPFLFDRGQSSQPIPGGITAEVIEIVDSNTWNVIVTGEDDFYSEGDIVTIELEKTPDSTQDCNLEIGDEIAITYTNFDIIKNRDGSSLILVSKIDILNKTN